MKNQTQRDWTILPDAELDYIIDHDSNKRIVRIAKAERKQRQRQKLRSVQITTSQPETASRVEVVGINLSFRDWFVVMFKAYLALVLVIVILAVPLLILYSLFWVLILGSLF
jgi:hypothetical protein